EVAVRLAFASAPDLPGRAFIEWYSKPRSERHVKHRHPELGLGVHSVLAPFGYGEHGPDIGHGKAESQRSTVNVKERLRGRCRGSGRSRRDDRRAEAGCLREALWTRQAAARPANP